MEAFRRECRNDNGKHAKSRQCRPNDAYGDDALQKLAYLDCSHCPDSPNYVSVFFNVWAQQRQRAQGTQKGQNGFLSAAAGNNR